MNAVAHGQWVGMRKVMRPERLTIRPGIAIIRVRRVRATISWFSTRVLPKIAVQRDHVVGEHSTLQPGRVGVEVSRRDVLETGAFFQVTDRELDHSVLAVELVDLDNITVDVGEEPMVSPVGPQLHVGLMCGQVDSSWFVLGWARCLGGVCGHSSRRSSVGSRRLTSREAAVVEAMVARSTRPTARATPLMGTA